MAKKPNKKILSKEEHCHRMNSLKIRWPAWVALLAFAISYETLPNVLYWGPRGLLIGLVIAIIISMIITQWRSRLRANYTLNLTICSIITIYLIVSVIRIVNAVFHGIIGPGHLIFSSMVLWSTNILVFALWYWNLDGGGPNKRELKESSWFGAFLFPQMQMTIACDKVLPSSIANWKPRFMDYLFLAFNTSTAFSPTDTAVLSHWAKLISMIQAVISLTIILMLAARAINIINPVLH